MRILYHALVELDLPDGHAIHTRQICESLVRAGHEVTLVAPRAERPAIEGVAFEGVPFLGFSGPRLRLYRFLAARRLRRLVRQRPPTVIVDKGTPLLGEIARLGAARGIPAVVELNGLFDDPKDPFHRQTRAGLQQAAAAGVLRYLGVSPRLGELSDAAGRFGPTPFALFENGADPELFPADGPATPRGDLGVPGDALLVVYAGSDNPAYDFEVTVAGIAAARSRGVPAHLLAVGPPGLRRRVGEAAAALRLAEHVTTRKPVPHDQVAPLIRAADAGVVILDERLAHMAPTALKLKELLLVGVPVVCNLPRCWNGWSLSGSVWGLERADARGLAVALAKIDADRPAARRRASRGGDIVRSRYTWLSVAETYVSCLETLLGREADGSSTTSRRQDLASVP